MAEIQSYTYHYYVKEFQKKLTQKAAWVAVPEEMKLGSINHEFFPGISVIGFQKFMYLIRGLCYLYNCRIVCLEGKSLSSGYYIIGSSEMSRALLQAWIEWLKGMFESNVKRYKHGIRNKYTSPKRKKLVGDFRDHLVKRLLNAMERALELAGKDNKDLNQKNLIFRNYVNRYSSLKTKRLISCLTELPK